MSAHKRGKIAALIGLEGGQCHRRQSQDPTRVIMSSASAYMTLTHARYEHSTDSSGDIADTKVKHHGGLAPFGKDIVQEIDRLGMIVDISHVADQNLSGTRSESTRRRFSHRTRHAALCRNARREHDRRDDRSSREEGRHHSDEACLRLSERTRSHGQPGRGGRLNTKFGDDEDELRVYVESQFAARDPGRRRRSDR